MNTFVDTFNAEYGASVDRKLISLPLNSTNNNPGIYINNLEFWSVVQKAPYYRLPGGVVEFVYTSTNIHKLHASPLKVVYPRECMLEKINSSRCVNFNMPDPQSINLADWTVLMTEDSHYSQHIFCVNCNPTSNQYGNIMLIWIYVDYVYINISHPNIEALTQHIMQWIADPAPVVTVESIEYFMKSIRLQYTLQMTVREILSCNIIPGLSTYDTDRIKKLIWTDMFTGKLNSAVCSFSYNAWYAKK